MIVVVYRNNPPSCPAAHLRGSAACLLQLCGQLFGGGRLLLSTFQLRHQRGSLAGKVLLLLLGRGAEGGQLQGQGVQGVQARQVSECALGERP